ncbi:spaetzle-processing enzyme-like [Drosophila rhopaloa]|uniref:CLIP domain-containing serine protease n=1 Tax=Drosophila rhopaloa TaxID=1041015 RepID=A0A6P4EXY6_DRORH|nr:spaetzle-processing enzyme-like [Drosophila rhopaloa]
MSNRREASALFMRKQCGIDHTRTLIGQRVYICCPIPVCLTDEKCVRLDKCPHLRDILNSENVTPAKKEIMRRQCGIDASQRFLEHRMYICCPKMGTFLPKDEKCGQGTEEAGLSELPWLAMLFYQNTTTWDPILDFNCEGSLINNRYVLTAAHCVVPGKEISMDLVLRKVRLGEQSNPDWVGLNAGKKRFAFGPSDFEVEDVIVHQNYTKSYVNDIALLRLEIPVRYTNQIAPICVPRAHTALKKSALRIAAWKMTNNGKPSQILLQSTIRENKQRCSKKFKYFDRPSQICAGVHGETDTCLGDSGGPLMGNITLSIYVVGISSYAAQPCGQKGVPGVYTKTGVYYKWIVKSLKP